MTQAHSQVITLEYKDLESKVDLENEIRKGLVNEDALGIVLVKNIPNYQQLRQNLLTTIPKVANLSPDILEQYELPETDYWIGWSHGRELRASDKQPDTHKGSFYFNPAPGDMVSDDHLSHPNVWIKEIPEFEKYCMELSQMMLKVGKLVAIQCDKFSHKSKVSTIIETSHSHKARALHYFPATNDSLATKDNLCGWHLDNSMLTALTRPLYNKNGDAIESDDSGLFIKNRAGDIVSVSIPSNCMAFQTGEALQIYTNGVIRATPHCVSSSKTLNMHSRNTMALFMQPDSDFLLKENYTFKDFCKEVVKRHT